MGGQLPNGKNENLIVYYIINILKKSFKKILND